MIKRADIEGSKSNVAKNARMPQASYPCGNYSDTFNLNQFNIKGSFYVDFSLIIIIKQSLYH